MPKLEIDTHISGTRLYRARLRTKDQKRTSQVVYRVGKFYWDVEQQLLDEFGCCHHITEVKLMTPEQVIHAACKHLPTLQ